MYKKSLGSQVIFISLVHQLRYSEVFTVITDKSSAGGLVQQNQPFSFSELNDILCHLSLFLREAISPPRHIRHTETLA